MAFVNSQTSNAKETGRLVRWPYKSHDSHRSLKNNNHSKRSRALCKPSDTGHSWATTFGGNTRRVVTKSQSPSRNAKCLTLQPFPRIAAGMNISVTMAQFFPEIWNPRKKFPIVNSGKSRTFLLEIASRHGICLICAQCKLHGRQKSQGGVEIVIGLYLGNRGSDENLRIIREKYFV